MSRRVDAAARALVRPASRRGALAALAAAVGLRAGARPTAAGCGECPAEAPCCRKGRCRPSCGGACCGRCFGVRDEVAGGVFAGSEFCCTDAAGAFCRGRKGRRTADRCCYKDETCVRGRCCGDGSLGTVRCGGKCCPIASCCGDRCCPKGEVCAGDPPRCRSADRACDACEPDEACVGGRCCAGDRICEGTPAGDVCCPWGEYCDRIDPAPPRCCPVNTICQSYRGQRVRP